MRVPHTKLLPMELYPTASLRIGRNTTEAILTSNQWSSTKHDDAYQYLLVGLVSANVELANRAYEAAHLHYLYLVGKRNDQVT